MKYSSVYLYSLALVGVAGETTETFTEYASTLTLTQTIFSAPPGVRYYGDGLSSLDQTSEIPTTTESEITSASDVPASSTIATVLSSTTPDVVPSPSTTSSSTSTLQEISSSAPTTSSTAAPTIVSSSPSSITTLISSTVSPTTIALPTSTTVDPLSSISSSTPESSTRTSSTASSLGTWEASILDLHNQKRALHGVPALTWDQKLADFGATYGAQVFSCDNVELIHSGGPYGENLGAGNFGSDVGVVNAWYDEIKDFDFTKPEYSSKTGHFSQVVWKATTKVGCARILCNNAWAQYTICEYDDVRGNVIGTDRASGKTYFQLNVLPLI